MILKKFFLTSALAELLVSDPMPILAAFCV
jgi:hypothetical protein